MKISGAEGMSQEQMNFELQSGAKLGFYMYCISLIVITFRRSSPVYLMRTGEGRSAKSLPWSAITLLLGWWGIPWGPIYSIQSLITNFKGGKDVTPASPVAQLASKVVPAV